MYIVHVEYLQKCIYVVEGCPYTCTCTFMFEPTTPVLKAGQASRYLVPLYGFVKFFVCLGLLF